ncbi:enoyl-CoA hydratase/isomerase family protein [bacterium]|nr:enoyl-CoA hydratase/isomerase family protein [bacterium]
MNYETLLFEKEDGLAIVTLNRPKAKNALSFQLKDELAVAFDEIEKDDDIKVVILTGGKDAFSAGADIKERSIVQQTQPEFYFVQRKSHEFYSRIENFEKPIIAAISGVAVGGGCELSLVCDLRIASETARFGLPEVKLGVIPAAGGTQRLPRLIGETRAKEMIYTGDFINAEEALSIGLVNKVHAVDRFLEEAKVLAQKLAENPPLAVKFAKRAVNAGMQMDLKSALDYETYCAALLASSEDRIEGFMAFVEKRKPVYKGR